MSKKTNTNPAAEEKAPNPSAADQAEEVKKQEQPAADAEAKKAEEVKKAAISEMEPVETEELVEEESAGGTYWEE